MTNEELFDVFASISDKNDLTNFISMLRVASANIKSEKLLELINRCLEFCSKNDYSVGIVNLFELKIKQLFHHQNQLNVIEKILNQMIQLSTKIDYTNGLALAYSTKWGVEKLKGNKEQSLIALESSMNILNKASKRDDYIYFICNYTFAFSKWTENHDITSSITFEECFEYFSKNGFYRSSVQTIGILGIIYTRTQNSRKILDLSRKILSDKFILEDLPKDIHAIYYYFVGLGHMIDLRLNLAESFFEESYTLLRPIYNESIYFSNHLLLHSYMVSVKALQGKLEETLTLTKEAEDLLKQEFFEQNLDLGTKKQINHTLNLNKFYVYSRLKDFDSEETQDLFEEVFTGSKTLYSNFLLISEYLLNSNLEPAKLEELLNTNNFSINRVKHIISFVLLKRKEEDTGKQQFLERIEILSNRKKTDKTTFIENVFSDLLIAQQLYSLKRYGEIYPLLRKYENNLDRIEVLELRVFMEAFIQVGAYKTGDPLGPALQYMAIKKCRQYGFSRLENKLLDYLNMQGKDSFNVISKNS